MKNRRVLTAITAITAAIIIFLVVALGTARAQSVPTYFVYTPAANQSITTPNGNSYTSDINHLIYNPSVLDINFLVSIGGVVLNQRDNVAAGPPTANNDYTQLYGIGSQWYNTLNNFTYTLTNPGSTPGNATWAAAVASSLVVGTTAITSGTANNILFDNGGTLGSLGTVDNGALITSASGAPSISTTLPAAVQANITALGTVTSGEINGITGINGTPIGAATPSAGAFTALTSAATGIYTNTQMNDLATVLLNSLSPLTEFQAAQGANYATEALVGGVAVPSTSTVYQSNAFAAYANSSSTTTNVVAGYFQARALVAGASIWGANSLVSDGGFAISARAFEGDVNCTNVASSCDGFQALGASTVTPGLARAFHVGSFGTAQWRSGFQTDDGVAMSGISIGAATTGNGVGSQPIDLRSRSSGGTNYTSQIESAADGSLFLFSAASGVVLSPAGVSAFAVVGSGSGTQVNYLEAVSAPTGVSPVLQPVGTDTNINLQITPKGTGLLQMGNGAVVFGAPASSNVSVSFVPTSTGQYDFLNFQDGSTNITQLLKDPSNNFDIFDVAHSAIAFQISAAGLTTIGEPSGTLNLASATIQVGGTAGVTCAANTVTLLTETVKNGIVTHC